MPPKYNVVEYCAVVLHININYSNTNTTFLLIKGPAKSYLYVIRDLLYDQKKAVNG
jgi:hypothetical protein